MRREVVIGRNSSVWRRLSARADVQSRQPLALGHREVSDFDFGANDRVWVLSYSRHAQDNEQLIARLERSPAAEIVYIGSSSSAVAESVSCYEYPRVKHQAEQRVLGLAQGHVLTVGLIYEDLAELPAGDNAATSIAELAAFFVAPDWERTPYGHPRRQVLLRIVQRPFRHVVERACHAAYGALMSLCGRRPCLLRPLDLTLRMAGMRWYGYTFLANRLWKSKIS